jgi:membrane protein DedA with SNARE-associated domain
MTIQELLIRYGLMAVFVGAATEGDVTMILAGVTAHLGLLDLSSVMALGALGSFAGDLSLYGIGRARAGSFRRSRIYRQGGRAIERLVDRLGVWQIAGARFVYGTRVVSMLFWGIRGLPFWRFACVDLAGCVLWSIVLGGAGFMVSNSAAALVGRVRRVRAWLGVALVISVAMMVAFRLLLHFWRLRARPRGGSRA